MTAHVSNVVDNLVINVEQKTQSRRNIHEPFAIGEGMLFSQDLVFTQYSGIVSTTWHTFLKKNERQDEIKPVKILLHVNVESLFFFKPKESKENYLSIFVGCNYKKIITVF